MPGTGHYFFHLWSCTPWKLSLLPLGADIRRAVHPHERTIEVDDKMENESLCSLYLSPQDSTMLSDVTEVGWLPSIAKEDQEVRHAFYKDCGLNVQASQKYRCRYQKSSPSSSKNH